MILFAVGGKELSVQKEDSVQKEGSVQGVSVQGGSLSGGLCLRGLCPGGGGSLPGRPPMQLCVGGMHPTGMDSCFSKVHCVKGLL